MKDSTAQHRWDNLSLRRSIYLRRAIDCSSLTIPSLIPESDQNYAWGAEPYSRLNSLYQGAGARGVSGLSAKLLLALMPPSQPFFKLSPQGAVSNFVDQSSEDPQKTLSEIDVALSDIEQQVLKKLDKLKARTALFEACKHLVCGGNALLYVGPDSIKMFSLRSYCVSRDPEGNVSEIVVREEVAREFLPLAPTQRIRTAPPPLTSTPGSSGSLMRTGLSGTRSTRARRSPVPRASAVWTPAPGFHSGSTALQVSPTEGRS